MDNNKTIYRAISLMVSFVLFCLSVTGCVIKQNRDSLPRIIEETTPWYHCESNGVRPHQMDCSDIPIHAIDYQSCYSGFYNDDTKSIAVETLKATHADAVYGATSKVIYNELFECNHVWFGIYSKYYFNDQNEIIREGYFAFYDLMSRWDNGSYPYKVLYDYPE